MNELIMGADLGIIFCHISNEICATFEIYREGIPCLTDWRMIVYYVSLDKAHWTQFWS